MENRMHDDGEVRPKSVRELAATVSFRAAEIQREGSGLGLLEKRWRQDDRICSEAVKVQKPLPPPISPLGIEREQR